MININKETPEIQVLRAGKGWLAVDKPAGMTVHNESGRDLCSYALEIISHDPILKKQVEMDPGFGVHPVHRLDRETSGVVLLSTNPTMFRYFSRLFETRQVQKRYIAILHGRLDSPGTGNPWGAWRWPLSKTPAGRGQPQGANPRQPSETRYKIIGHSIHYTMTEIEILTGRIHQIRRHAKLSGHPVAGDGRYGSTRAVKYLLQHQAFDRLALHAKALSLSLPDAPVPMTVQTPAIPEQIRALFENDMTPKFLGKV